ncbi:MAG: hypothetical protein ACOCNX_00865 [Prevotella sp.]
MSTFGILYIVFGLIAVVGCVLDADEPRRFICNDKGMRTRYFCAKMYKYIWKHCPSMVKPVYFAAPPVRNIPNDRLFEFNFIIGYIDVENFRSMSKGEYESLLLKGHIPYNFSKNFVLDKFIRERVRREFCNRILDFVSIRAFNVPSGDVKVNAQLVCRPPKSPKFAWAEKKEMFETENRFES